MKTDLFDYTLPPHLIATYPPLNRDGGRLLVTLPQQQKIQHHKITDLPSLLPTNCLVVANNSKVIPARLQARRPTGGAVEVLLVRLESEDDTSCTWNTLCKANKPLRIGDTLLFDNTSTATIIQSGEMGHRTLRLNVRSEAFRNYVDQQGAIPLPPYLKRDAEESDRERYQTVFAEYEGSVAAPTAGLHLTEALISEIRSNGCAVEYVTLHVGPGTFRPITAERTDEHKMDVEHYHISNAVADKINDAKNDGRPVIAIGTTTVRTLEGCAARHNGRVVAGDGATDIFISPPYPFNVVSGLLTNFHLPKSTLLCLVSAMGGREFILKAYDEAVQNEYRFYSYGDAMLVLPEDA
ncbi:MAG: tRNA preQ1(34) S-adenosylmethionine ribosyltransferase-isomerase QueA [Deltaproteobacteria bacterium]|nr:tRNA preQ1(34) S-adenosylmethionine ribosyltransferase-isomerase QueA [Deltaproteobacteria bacterium]MBN2673420.1 tRNA preQ1(34) S-adenosylmethionine ribosyltransferase-isomerase QueA [Deltaproteobacteria bacterium]